MHFQTLPAAQLRSVQGGATPLYHLMLPASFTIVAQLLLSLSGSGTDPDRDDDGGGN